MIGRKLFVKNLLLWYGLYKRDLPWRDTTDAYKIWISEVILQQTRVSQGLPYFQKFMETYPNIHQLAAANEQEILRLWQGLGYYSRAKNLHACSKKIVADFQGEFPDTYSALLGLKGIGKYTAAAIASFAFGRRVAVVDGNVYRVISRVFGIFEDLSSLSGQRKFEEIANQLIPGEDSATYNQAIMEFGAINCTPKNPLCQDCTFNSICFAFKNQKQSVLPVKTKRPKIRERHFNYMVIKREDGIFMKKRNGKDIWDGLYDFLLLESDKETGIEALDHPLLLRLREAGAVVSDISEKYRHTLTHQRLFVKFFTLEVTLNPVLDRFAEEYDLSYFSLSEIADLPKPILIDNYLSKKNF